MAKKKLSKAVEKQAASQALPADNDLLQHVVETSKRPEKPKKGEQEAKLMLDFATSDAWKKLRHYIERKVSRLDNMTAESARGDNFNLETIGFRYLIQDQIQNFAQDIINYVELPLKARAAEVESDKPEEGTTTTPEDEG